MKPLLIFIVCIIIVGFSLTVWLAPKAVSPPPLGAGPFLPLTILELQKLLNADRQTKIKEDGRWGLKTQTAFLEHMERSEKNWCNDLASWHYEQAKN